MNDLLENIASLFKVVIGLGVVDFMLISVLPVKDFLEYAEIIRLIFGLFGLAVAILILVFKVKDYKVNKKTKEILEEQEDRFIYHRDYSKNDEK